MDNGFATADVMLKKLRDACGHNQAAFARKHGLSQCYINMVLNGERPLGPGIAAALGYEPITGWVKAA